MSSSPGLVRATQRNTTHAGGIRLMKMPADRVCGAAQVEVVVDLVERKAPLHQLRRLLPAPEAVGAQAADVLHGVGGEDRAVGPQHHHRRDADHVKLGLQLPVVQDVQDESSYWSQLFFTNARSRNKSTMMPCYKDLGHSAPNFSTAFLLYPSQFHLLSRQQHNADSRSQDRAGAMLSSRSSLALQWPSSACSTSEFCALVLSSPCSRLLPERARSRSVGTVSLSHPAEVSVSLVYPGWPPGSIWIPMASMSLVFSALRHDMEMEKGECEDGAFSRTSVVGVGRVEGQQVGGGPAEVQ
ncbi:hypothetical protein CRUP_020078 [Coryphaenoides rupestris]|nr:hypothetical protein CRUP_020078 [Coryphaenoides rupestris]